MSSQKPTEAESSYESRNDLALRSAVADPAAEPRSIPKPPTSPQSTKSKRASLTGSTAKINNSQPNGASGTSKGDSKLVEVCQSGPYRRFARQFRCVDLLYPSRAHFWPARTESALRMLTHAAT